MLRRVIALLIFTVVAGIAGCGEKAAVPPEKVGVPKDAPKDAEAKLPPPPKG